MVNVRSRRRMGDSSLRQGRGRRVRRAGWLGFSSCLALLWLNSPIIVYLSEFFVVVCNGRF